MNDEELEKLNDRQSFLMPKSLSPLINMMDYQERGILLTAILEFSITQNEIDLSKSKLVHGAFNMFKQEFIKDAKKYLRTCDRNSQNAKKRWGKNNV